MCNVPEIEFLRRSQLGLTSSIVYSRRCIKPVRSKAGRSSVIDVPGPLITTKTNVNLTNCHGFKIPPCETVSLPVPSAYPRKQYPHLLFGVASSYERLNASLPEFTHWLSSTGAQLLGIVADANEGAGNRYNLTALEAEYRDRGILATFIPPTIKKRINRVDQDGDSDVDAPVEQHHFLLVRELSAIARPGVTRWISIIDDDTFFPSLYPLDQALARHDHTRPTWLGALSDDFNSVRFWGYMAYGGAGVFLSTPLASVVADRSDQCLREATTDQGDGLLRDCIYTHTRTTLTILPGLYQHDFRGDPSGFFESGLLPLSLHHWKSWYKAPVAAIARIATHVCGACLMQRFRFGNDTILSNGYSVATYADGVLPGLDLERVEGTWERATSDYDPTYGQVRPKVDAESKKSYVLRDAILETRAKGRKVFRQLYVYRAGENTWEQEWSPTGVDEVVELVWEL
ncbi:glycosyltransferase family 31 protein [Cercophora newfieldiana]|uniref:Glycosyltransferase family 31 protein n=1 Tax=Cercophora newfieldiana TaxID=92897 RepID=A0AA39YAA4_9PEZI|nr:glycosyltransferase family 31 protein [Cercophora newfieldiana]